MIGVPVTLQARQELVPHPVGIRVAVRYEGVIRKRPQFPRRSFLVRSVLGPDDLIRGFGVPREVKNIAHQHQDQDRHRRGGD